MSGITNRRKGHEGERIYAKVFKDLGFLHCITARYGSRVHDDAGIDLINLPFNVQIKTGAHRGMNISNVLSGIKDRFSKLFPPNAPEHDNITIMIHRKAVGRGRRRKEYDDMVHMSFEDFVKLIKKIEWESLSQNKK